MTECTLILNIPVLADAIPGWAVYLVDSPGFGEDNQTIKLLADRAVNCSAAYVFVNSPNTMGLEQNSHFLKQLKEKDKGQVVYTDNESVHMGTVYMIVCNG